MTDNHDDLVIDLRDVHKRFGDQLIFDGLNLQIHRGEFVALLGASGSGKTTLLRTLSGLDAANSGSVSVARNRTIVFQEPRLLPFNRVLGNVLLGLPKTAANRAHAIKALEEVGLASKARSWPVSLSGGEAQRVALARALVRTPELLLADEPFAALDALTRLHMQWLVQELWRQHRPAVLLITHDVGEAILLADRIVVLREHRIALDLRVTLDRPRRSGVEFSKLADRLLAELGVLKDDEQNKLELDLAS